MKNLNELISAYINLKESENCSKQTISNYIIRLKNFSIFIKEHYNTEDISEISEEVIIAYKKFLITVKNNSANTLRTKTVELKQFFDYVCGREDMADYKNPMSNISIPDKDEVVKDFFNIEETKTFINALYNHSKDINSLNYTGISRTFFLRNASLFVAALITACRISALIDVRMSDFNSEDQTLVFRHVKGGGEQIKYLQPIAVELIKKYIKEQRPTGLPENAPLWVREKKASHNPNIAVKETNLYLDKDTGKYYTEMGRMEMTELCKHYTKVFGGKELSMHELRHSSAMYVFANGGSVADIQQILGHKNATTTENYLHSLQNQREKEVVNKVWANIN